MARLVDGQVVQRWRDHRRHGGNAIPVQTAWTITTQCPHCEETQPLYPRTYIPLVDKPWLDALDVLDARAAS